MSKEQNSKTPWPAAPYKVVMAHNGFIITAMDGAYDCAVVRNIGNQDNAAIAYLFAAAPVMAELLERVLDSAAAESLLRKDRELINEIDALLSRIGGEAP